MRNFPIAVLSTLFITAAESAGGAADTWGPTTLLLPREPIEIGQPLPGTGDAAIIPMPVLFADVPEFQLVLVDIRAIVPSATTRTITADGSIFALGSAGETYGGTWGGSYVDNFELKFWRSNPPHSSVESFVIDGVDTWIDSSSAVAGPNFFVSGVNFATGAVEVFFSTTNGVFWSPLRTFVPASPLYYNFYGGERVSLWVDPDWTGAAADVPNCIFYETLVASTTTKRIDCADGADPTFALPIITDIPNPAGLPDFFVENQAAGAPGGGALGAFTLRSLQQNRCWRMDPANTFEMVACGPTPVPPGSTPQSAAIAWTHSAAHFVSVSNSPGSTRHTLWPHGSGPGGSTSIPGPTVDRGPLAMASGPGAGLFAPVELFFPSASPFAGSSVAGASGLATAEYPAPLFADGVETGDTSGWSSTVP